MRLCGELRRSFPYPLIRMEEDRPTLPRVLERTLQLFYIVHYAEAAFCVGVFEWIFGLYLCEGRCRSYARRWHYGFYRRERHLVHKLVGGHLLWRSARRQLE